jgi:hypothetical protein
MSDQCKSLFHCSWRLRRQALITKYPTFWTAVPMSCILYSWTRSVICLPWCQFHGLDPWVSICITQSRSYNISFLGYIPVNRPYTVSSKSNNDISIYRRFSHNFLLEVCVTEDWGWSAYICPSPLHLSSFLGRSHCRPKKTLFVLSYTLCFPSILLNVA